MHTFKYAYIHTYIHMQIDTYTYKYLHVHKYVLDLQHTHTHTLLSRDRIIHLLFLSSLSSIISTHEYFSVYFMRHSSFSFFMILIFLACPIDCWICHLFKKKKLKNNLSHLCLGSVDGRVLLLQISKKKILQAFVHSKVIKTRYHK